MKSKQSETQSYLGAFVRVQNRKVKPDGFARPGTSLDNLSQCVIMEAVAAQVADGNILSLIEKFLRAGVMEEGVFKPTTVGTPQGGAMSPCWLTSSSIIWTGSWSNAGFGLFAMPMTSFSSALPAPMLRRPSSLCAPFFRISAWR